jgi:nicotinamidase-related amidase
VLLVGGLTDVCIHYTAVDAHQHDYRFRVLTDCVGGSTLEAHDAALNAMYYLQRDSMVTAAQTNEWLDTLPTPAPVNPIHELVR